MTYFLAEHPRGMTIDPATGLIHWTPTGDDLNASDTYHVTITVADDGNGSAGQTKDAGVSFTITLTATNTAPQLDVIEEVYSVAENDPVSIDFNATDAEGHTVAYRIDANTLPDGASIDPETGLFNWTPRLNPAGYYDEIVLRASDGSDSTYQKFAIDVSNAIRDVNLDGTVDSADRELLVMNYGFGSPSPLAAGSNSSTEASPLSLSFTGSGGIGTTLDAAPLSTLLDASAETSQASTVISNGSFNHSDTYKGGFGWRTRGAARFENGSAVLTEDGAYTTTLYQNFTVGADAISLQFTITSLALFATEDQPGDAFAVSLLDRLTQQPVIAGPDGFSHSDSFLNVQADGTHHLSQSVTIDGLSETNALPSLTDSVLVTIDLTGIDAGSAHGTAIVDTSQGTIRYTPHAHYSGTDSFTNTVADGSETLLVEISGLPAGAFLSAGTQYAAGSYHLTQEELSGLRVTPPVDSLDPFTLFITATTTETNGEWQSLTAQMGVVVTPAVAVTWPVRGQGLGVRGPGQTYSQSSIPYHSSFGCGYAALGSTRISRSSTVWPETYVSSPCRENRTLWRTSGTPTTGRLIRSRLTQAASPLRTDIISSNSASTDLRRSRSTWDRWETELTRSTPKSKTPPETSRCRPD